MKHEISVEIKKCFSRHNNVIVKLVLNFIDFYPPPLSGLALARSAAGFPFDVSARILQHYDEDRQGVELPI